MFNRVASISRRFVLKSSDKYNNKFHISGEIQSVHGKNFNIKKKQKRSITSRLSDRGSSMIHVK